MPTVQCKDQDKLERQLAWAVQMIRQAQKQNWHGVLTLKFENGVMKMGSNSQTNLKPPV